MLRLENVGLRYGDGPEILKDVSFAVRPGDFYFLTGPSGAGKSSLLKLLFLALRPTRGRLHIFGEDVSGLSHGRLPPIRRRIGVVFQEFRLARGTLEYRGEKVDPGLITKTAILTIEGEKDDICSVGQTSAALGLCADAPIKRNYVQPGAGHYGVFSGRRWQTEIYPVVRNFILALE